MESWLKIDFSNNYSNPQNYQSRHAQFCLNDVEIKDLVIPEGITEIKEYAFNYCNSLQTVTIPNSVTTIGSNAFRDCENIVSLTISNGVTEIGYEAFRYCHNLPSVVIPNSVKKIDGRAFQECYRLASITMGNAIEDIGSYAFYRCYDLASMVCSTMNVPSTMSDAFIESNSSSATLYVPSQSVEAYKSTNPWNNFGTIVAILQSDLEIKLEEGWNWISHNAAQSLKPEDIFGENVVEMKSQTKGLIRDEKYGVVGNLKELVATEAYKVKAAQADTKPYQLSDYLFDAAANAITLKAGWNWIGYPMANEGSVEEALKNFEPMAGDCIVGLDHFTTYTGNSWDGSLMVLTPGEGYMYKSGAEKSVHFSQPSEAKAREAKARTESEESHWSCDIHKYPNRMPAIVSLYIKDVEADVNDYDVAAFCGDECRGAGKVVKGVVMMNVCGEGDETITFKAIDKKSGIVMDIKESVPFSADVLGEYTEPFRLNIGSESASGIEIVHSSQFAVDNEIIYNVAGQRAGTLQQGVNIIRMKDGKTKKVQVK